MSVNITKLRVITGAVVVAAAGASGFFMQSGFTAETAAVAPSDPVPAVEEAVMTTANVAVPESPVLDSPALPQAPFIDQVTRAATPPVVLIPSVVPDMPSSPDLGDLTMASADSEPVTPSASSEEITLTIAECEAGFTSMAAPGAIVFLTLEAPCYAGQKVDIFHAGMRFSENLDENGMLEMSVPAMEEDAFFNALFMDGSTESTDILMLTVNDYQRTALFWKGNSGFALYALENGAEYGQLGHISAETPYSSARGISGEGGFLNLLGTGENAYKTAIYSYPSFLTDTNPRPEISVEVQVQEGNCGSEVSATVMTNSGSGALETKPLIMAVPGCEAIGEYLVLKNLPQDLRIAAN